MSTEAARRGAYARLALELREKQEQAAREAADKIEFVASFGSGQKSVTGKSLTEVGDELLERGYVMKRAKALDGEPTKLIVPHKDGFKEAIVRVRKRK